MGVCWWLWELAGVGWDGAGLGIVGGLWMWELAGVGWYGGGLGSVGVELGFVLDDDIAVGVIIQYDGEDWSWVDWCGFWGVWRWCGW